MEGGHATTKGWSPICISFFHLSKKDEKTSAKRGKLRAKSQPARSYFTKNYDRRSGVSTALPTYKLPARERYSHNLSSLELLWPLPSEWLQLVVSKTLRPRLDLRLSCCKLTPGEMIMLLGRERSSLFIAVHLLKAFLLDEGTNCRAQDVRSFAAYLCF